MLSYGIIIEITDASANAAQAGLHTSDIITHYGGWRTRNMAEFDNALEKTRGSRNIEVVYIRENFMYTSNIKEGKLGVNTDIGEYDYDMIKHKNVVYLRVILSSGREINIRKLRLCYGGQLQEISRLREKISELMGGYSTGFGLIGNPGWVVAGTLLMRWFESAQSEKNRAEGILLATQLEQLAVSLQNSSELFDVGDISRSDIFNPSLWRAFGNFRGELAIESTCSTPHRFSQWGCFYHDGSDVISAETDDGEMCIRLSRIDIWQPVLR